MKSTTDSGEQSSLGAGPWPGKSGHVQEYSEPQNGENFVKSSPHPVYPCRARICACLFSRFDTDYLLIFKWAVARAFLHAFKGIDDVHAVNHFAKNGVAHVEPWCCHGGNEELTAIGAWSCVRHRQQSWPIKGVGAHALVFKIFTPNRFATTARASWIATLDHELFDNTVKNDAVVIAVFGMSTKVFTGFRRDIVEQFEFDAALCGLND